MANENPSVTLITQPFTLSFPEVLKPKAFQPPGATKPKGEPEFSFEGISEIESLAAWQILDKEKGDFFAGDVQKRCVKLAKEKWGADFDVIGSVKSKDLAWPFKSGDAKAEAKPGKAEHYRGRKSWRAHAKALINDRVNEPALYEAAKDGSLIKLMRSTEAGRSRINELFYGGAVCTAELNAVAGTSGDNKYVTFYLTSLVFEADGERLGGGSNMERLRGVKGGSSNYDPSEGMDGGDDLDDEIPY